MVLIGWQTEEDYHAMEVKARQAEDMARQLLQEAQLR